MDKELTQAIALTSNEQNGTITKQAMKFPPKSIAAIRDEDWKSLQSSITYLFHKKRLQGLELDALNEKVRNVRDSKIGQFIVESYKESILKKGMIVLREGIKEKKGCELIEKISEVWNRFYTEILPTLQAIFYPIQEQGVYIRNITLVGFRDIVLLKTRIEDALQSGEKVPSDLRQMLLVLASVREATPPSENYLRLEAMVVRVVSPYIAHNRLHETKADISVGGNVQTFQRERKPSVTQAFRDQVSKKFSSSISGEKSRSNSIETDQRNGSTKKLAENKSEPVHRKSSEDRYVKQKQKKSLDSFTAVSNLDPSFNKSSLKSFTSSSSYHAITESLDEEKDDLGSSLSRSREDSVDEDMMEYFAARNRRFQDKERQLQESVMSM